jgi:hypothetical protein
VAWAAPHWELGDLTQHSTDYIEDSRLGKKLEGGCQLRIESILATTSKEKAGIGTKSAAFYSGVYSCNAQLMSRRRERQPRQPTARVLGFWPLGGLDEESKERFPGEEFSHIFSRFNFSDLPPSIEIVANVYAMN